MLFAGSTRSAWRPRDRRQRARVRPRVTTRIRQEAEQRGDGSVGFGRRVPRILAHNFPAVRHRLARANGEARAEPRADGRWERKLDPAFMGGGGPRASATRSRASATSPGGWAGLAKILPDARGARRSQRRDVAEVADKMVDEVLPKGTLAVVPQAAHSVMTGQSGWVQSSGLRVRAGESVTALRINGPRRVNFWASLVRPWPVLTR